METQPEGAKQQPQENAWAARENQAKLAFESRLRRMSPEDRAAAIAADQKTQAERRARTEALKEEEAKLKDALSKVWNTAKSENIKQTGEKLSQALDALKKSEDDSYRIYLQTKVREAEKKIQADLKEGMINEADSEALADWKQKLAEHEAKQPYEEVTIEPWKKAS